MLGRTVQKYRAENNTTNNNANRSNVVVNIVNIADVVDSNNMEVASSCVVLIGIEPFVLDKFTVEGLKRDIRITKDSEGNIYINKTKAKFSEIGDGIKVLIMLSEEEQSK